MATNTFGKSTKRQQLQNAIANSQKIQEYGMNTQNFGGGYAGALGLLAQGLTVGVGAYQEYKQKQELAKLDAENNEKFINFANTYGDKDLASFSDQLSDETKQAYIMSKIAPNFLNKMSGNQIPASVQEYEYVKSLPQSAQAQYMNIKRNIAGEGSFIDTSGNVATLPGYGKANAQKKGMEQTARNESDLVYKPEIAGQSSYKTKTAKKDVEAQSNLPSQTFSIKNQLDTLNRLENHPGLRDIVGIKGGGAILSYVGKKEPIEGTKAAGAKALFDQVQGQQFLQSLDSLRGLGAVSNIEGVTATKAISALRTATSEKEFKENLNILKKTLNNGENRLKQRAQQGYQSRPSQQTSIQKSTIIKRYNPQTGRIE